MSRANLLVKFPDGTIRAGMYDGTCDTAWPPLYDTLDEAWTIYKSDRNDAMGIDCDEEFNKLPSEPVEIFTDYGGGFWWEGKAHPEWITDGCWPYHEDDIEIHDGYPDWANNYWRGENK